MTTEAYLIVALVVVLIIVAFAYWYYYMRMHPVYTLTTKYANGVSYPTVNDSKTLSSGTRTYTTNGHADGVFYETAPLNPAFATAILVIACSATDYSTVFTKAGGKSTAITSTTPTYLGVVVQYTPVAAGATPSTSALATDLTAAAATNANWLGVFDLTLLLASASAVTGFSMSDIGTASTSLLPTINKAASTNVGFPAVTTVASWPKAVDGSDIVFDSATAGYGLSLMCTTPAVTATD